MADIIRPGRGGVATKHVDNGDGSWAERMAVASGIVYTDVTLSLDTSAYADGDVLAATQTVSNAVRLDDQIGLLQSIVVIDEDDQGAGLTLVFLSANTSIGTENAAVSISDAGARDICGMVAVGSGDFTDLGGVRVANLNSIGLPIKPMTGTNDICVAAISRGAGTYTASGIRLRIGILCN